MEPPVRKFRMSAVGAWPERLSRPFRRAALAWAVVLTVLVCALAPAGLPHTATQGSAFNPATTSVALHAKAPRERLLRKRTLEPLPPGAAARRTILDAAAILPALPLPRLPARATPTRHRAVAASAPTAPARAVPWARAPPVA